MSKAMFLRGGSVLALVLCCGVAAPAIAADAADAAHTIDELVVTAQKRTQNLQDVPIVVTSVNKDLLRDSGVKDIKDLTIVVPGLMVTSTSTESSTTARIRGIGTVGDNLGLEPSVGIQIDGVYRPRNSVGFGDLGDVERIEVLKGPQGTLFGKNTSAGVINIMTERPSSTFRAEGEATASNFNGYGGSASVTGPLAGDKLAGRLFVGGRRRDGFYEVKTGSGPRTRTDDQNLNYGTARAQLLITPNDVLDVNVIVDFTHRVESCCAAVQIFDGPTAALIQAIDPAALGANHGGLAKPVDPFARVAYANRPNKSDIKDRGWSAEANWKTGWFGDATLTSITAMRDWKRAYAFDPDYTTVDILNYGIGSTNQSEFKQFSQELRLAGTSGKVDWLVGGFLASERLLQRVSLTYGKDFETYGSLLFSSGASPVLIGGALLGRAPGTSFVTGQGQQDRYDQKEDNVAIFTNDTWRVTDRLELTGGLRYTREHKTLETLYNNTDGGLGCSTLQARLGQSATGVATGALLCTSFANSLFTNLPDSQSLNEEELSGTVKAAYRFSPEVLTYASYARGYKAGGFNLDRQACGYAAATPAQQACGQMILASGRKLVNNPSQPTNQFSLQPVLDTSFKPEFVDSYEVGMKNTLLDRTLLLNATLFYQTYTGFQLNAFNGLTFAVVSIPEVVSKGADADLVWFPLKGLTLQAGITYADTRYSDEDASVLGAKCASIVYGAVATAGTPAGCSLLPGSQLSLAPPYSSSAAVTYEHEVGASLVARFNVSAKAQSSYNTGSDLNPVKMQKAYTLVNARVSLGPSSEAWAIELWSQNLFDKHYYQVGFDGTAQSGTYNAFLGMPRTYGATLRASF